MAKALAMNPAKLGKLANHKQEPWKAPLSIFIEECYRKRFERPSRKTKASPACAEVNLNIKDNL